MTHAVNEGPKGTSKYVLLLALTVVCSQASHRTVINRIGR
jgi:hypothetical protein